MALWPVANQMRVETNAVTATSVGWTTATASATPHVKGAWSQSIASTSFDTDMVVIYPGITTTTSGADTSLLVDIGIGGAGSEVVLIANIPRGHIPLGGHALHFPIRIPAGTRISTRIQSVVASKTFGTALFLSSGGAWTRERPASMITTYGADTTTSNGTALTDTASTNTKTAWTQIAAATTSRHRFLLPIPVMAPAITSITAGSYLFDIGIGGAGSEVVILPNLLMGSNAAEAIVQATFPPFGQNLPTGTRIAARFQKSVSGADPLFMVVLGIE